MRLWMARAQAQISSIHERRRFRIGSRRCIAHHLRAARDDQIFHPRHDVRRRDIHRRDARAAEAVERHAAGFHIVTGIERGHAAKIGTLLAALAGRAPDNVVDFGSLEIVALGDRTQHGGRELLRMNVCECALADLADAARCAACIDNISLSHFVLRCMNIDLRHGAGGAHFHARQMRSLLD